MKATRYLPDLADSIIPGSVAGELLTCHHVPTECFENAIGTHDGEDIRRQVVNGVNSWNAWSSCIIAVLDITVSKGHDHIYLEIELGSRAG